MDNMSKFEYAQNATPSEKNEDPPFATPPLLMRPPSKKMRPRGSQNHEKTSKIEGGSQEKNLWIQLNTVQVE